MRVRLTIDNINEKEDRKPAKYTHLENFKMCQVYLHIVIFQLKMNSIIKCESSTRVKRDAGLEGTPAYAKTKARQSYVER